MYKIYADDILIYDDTSQDPYVKVASPRLTLEENAAGSLKITIPPGNAGYDSIVRMDTEIKVTKDGYEYWSGRVIQENKDFWNNRTLTCEGELAYLNDTTQPQAEYSYTGPYCLRTYLIQLLTNHNNNVSADKRFGVDPNVMYVGVYADSIHTTTNYEKTIECVNKLIEEYGGCLKLRKVNGVRYLDWYTKDELGLNSQKIEFGKNLIDFTRSFDSTEYATVIVPLGAKQEESTVEGLENYLTVEEATVQGADGTRYVKSQDAIDTHGWIEKVVHWDDENDVNNLYKRGEKYLTDIQFDAMEIELTAFDLHYLNPEIQGLKIGDMVRVISVPHGVNRPFAVTKLDIPLDQPQDTKFQLGDSIKTSLTASNNKTNAEILEKLSQVPDIDEDAILQAAQANTAALMNMTLNGYVTLLTETTQEGMHSEGLYISQEIPLTDDEGNIIVDRYWKWSSTGLGYTDDGGDTWKAAITMDGTILGERIAAGSIHGSKITTGSLALVTSAGKEACKISLAVLGLPGDALVVGDINGNGQNMSSTTWARTIQKYYITQGTEVTANGYYFDSFRYADNITNESGFSLEYGYPGDGVFTVPVSAYYRFSLYLLGHSGEEIHEEDLSTIAAAIRIGEGSTAITSADIRINGMVTFTSMDDYLGTAGSTVIDGSNIRTGSITANRIDLYSGFRVTKNDEVTFEIASDGSVTVKGNITMGAGSTITWEAVDPPDELLYKSTSGGETTIIDGNGTKVTDVVPGYITSTYIDRAEIRSPTIYANVFTAIASNYATQTGQSGFRLDRESNDSTTPAFWIYYWNNEGWETHFGSEGSMVFENYTRFIGPVRFTDSTSDVDSYSPFIFRNTATFLSNIKLTHNVNYVDNYSSLPTGLTSSDVGRVCFVLN